MPTYYIYENRPPYTGILQHKVEAENVNIAFADFQREMGYEPGSEDANKLYNFDHYTVTME